MTTLTANLIVNSARPLIPYRWTYCSVLHVSDWRVLTIAKGPSRTAWILGTTVLCLFCVWCYRVQHRWMNRTIKFSVERLNSSCRIKVFFSLEKKKRKSVERRTFALCYTRHKWLLVSLSVMHYSSIYGYHKSTTIKCTNYKQLPFPFNFNSLCQSRPLFQIAPFPVFRTFWLAVNCA